MTSPRPPWSGMSTHSVVTPESAQPLPAQHGAEEDRTSRSHPVICPVLWLVALGLQIFDCPTGDISSPVGGSCQSWVKMSGACMSLEPGMTQRCLASCSHNDKDSVEGATATTSGRCQMTALDSHGHHLTWSSEHHGEGSVAQRGHLHLPGQGAEVSLLVTVT